MHFICLLPSFGITQEKDNERVMHIYGGYSLHVPDVGITILKTIQKSEEKSESIYFNHKTFISMTVSL